MEDRASRTRSRLDVGCRVTTIATTEAPRSKAAWREAGYRVPTKAKPVKIEPYLVPGYRRVWRERYLYSFEQVVKIDPGEATRRSAAADKAIATRIARMRQEMETVELTIKRGYTPAQVHALALCTHGGNYLGRVGPFRWSNRTARNAIRHSLTNYEAQWDRINRGFTGAVAYNVLRDRVDALVDEAYPEYEEGAPEVRHPDCVLVY